MPIIRLFIYLSWLVAGKSGFLMNAVEEIRPGCRNLQRPLIMVNLSEMLLVGMLYRNTGYQISELKSSLVCWFNKMIWARIFFFIEMGQGSCYWLNVAKHRVIE